MPALSYDSSCAALVRGITERRGLLCLVGEAGTGKSLLLRQVIGAPPPGVRPVVLQQLSVKLDGLVELLEALLENSLRPRNANVSPSQRVTSTSNPAP